MSSWFTAQAFFLDKFSRFFELCGILSFTKTFSHEGPQQSPLYSTTHVHPFNEPVTGKNQCPPGRYKLQSPSPGSPGKCATRVFLWEKISTRDSAEREPCARCPGKKKAVGCATAPLRTVPRGRKNRLFLAPPGCQNDSLESLILFCFEAKKTTCRTPVFRSSGLRTPAPFQLLGWKE